MKEKDAKMTHMHVLMIVMFVGFQVCVQGSDLTVKTSRENCTGSIDCANIYCGGLDNSTKLTEVVMIQISRHGNEPLALLKSNSLSYGTGKPPKIHAKGEIHGLKSYLNVMMLLPKREDSGIYKCSVVFIDGTGTVKHVTGQSVLVVDELDATANAIKLQAIENNMKSSMEKIKNIKVVTFIPPRGNAIPAFSAGIGRSQYYIHDQQTLLFEDVLTNIGNGYKPDRGTFIAPVSGVYAFFLTLEMEYKGTGAGFSLRTDTRELGRLYVENKYHGDQSSISSVVNLNIGEQVKVVVSYKEKPRAYVWPNRYSMFSGYLIKREND